MTRWLVVVLLLPLLGAMVTREARADEAPGPAPAILPPGARPAARSVWWVLRRSALIGLGAGVVGGVPLVALYGSRRVTPVTVPLAVFAGGALLTTGAAALWALADGAHRAGAPGAVAPWFVEGGAVWVDDPLLDTAALLRLGGQWQGDQLRVAPHALIAIDGDEQRGGVALGWRLRGAAPGRGIVDDGSRLEVRGAVTADRAGGAGFTLVTVEAGIGGRLDLARLHPRLRGAFVDGALGYGVETVAYADGAVEATDVLIARFGFGGYLGCGRGEASAWYDHRRDDLAGGFAAWRAAGFFGSLGASGAYQVTRRWGVVAEVQLGSAMVSTLALRWRGGPP